MVIQSINTQSTPNSVTVQQLAAIPFELRGDDAATHPFNVDTSLMQNSDNQNQNLFAPAYIRPIFDISSGRVANFNLNLNNDPEILTQLDAGRDSTSADGFWTVYLQGSFEGNVLLDADPNTGTVELGATPSFSSRGSVIFVEALRDVQAVVGSAAQDLPRINTVHEVGHQFNLQHSEGGIMTPGILVVQPFTPESLNNLRRRPHP
jgi:hypothetical protein